MKHIFLSLALLLCTNIIIATETTSCDTHHSALKHIFTKSALMAKAKDSYATIESAEAYLETGATVDVEDNNGNTPLQLAAINNNAKFVEFFIGRGADIEHKNKEGQTALLLAAKHKALDAAKVLLEYKAEINAEDHEKNKPLFYAIVTNNVAMVELLLEHGADYTTKNNRKKCNCSPLFTASMSGSFPIVQALITYNAIKLSQLKNPAYQGSIQLKDPAFVDGNVGNNATPLTAAITWGHYEIADYLIGQGADVNKTTNDGNTALHWWASYGGTAKTLELLLAHGANIDAQDKTGHTPLMMAVQQKQEQSAELLINHRADTSIKCNKDITWEDHTNNNKLRNVIMLMIEDYQHQHEHKDEV